MFLDDTFPAVDVDSVVVLQKQTLLDEWEACLLYLADKLVQGTRIVSLEGRMEQMRVRFAGDSEAVAAAETRLGKAMRLRGEVETLCGKSVDAVLEEP